MNPKPSQTTLEAFNIISEPIRLAGGRGLCYRAGDAVLRPSENDQEAQWIAEVIKSLPKTSEYRVPIPISVVDNPTTFVHNGWTAADFLAGVSPPNPDFRSLLDVCRAFHKDLERLDLRQQPFLTERTDRWREAELVTWNEKRLEQVEKVNTEILAHFQPVLSDLADMMRPLPENLKDQMIHGDMTGNVLFEDGELPGIIDITPYWRPAEYAEAIIVADGLAWYGQGEEIVKYYGASQTRLQLLIRALYWRCLTFAIDPDLVWVRDNITKADYSKATALVRHILEDERRSFVERP